MEDVQATTAPSAATEQRHLLVHAMGTPLIANAYHLPEENSTSPAPADEPFVETGAAHIPLSDMPLEPGNDHLAVTVTAASTKPSSHEDSDTLITTVLHSTDHRSANDFRPAAKEVHATDRRISLDQRTSPDVPQIPSSKAIFPPTPQDGLDQDITFLDRDQPMDDMEPPRIQAFAKLEFDDGEFYMNTYQVILGRDMNAANAARQLEAAPETRRTLRRASGSIDGSRNMAGSVISDSGGIFAIYEGNEDRSTSPSSFSMSRKNSLGFLATHEEPKSIYFEGDNVHPQEPSPDDCPLIPIHPPTNPERLASGYRSISRKHVQIYYNFENQVFEVKVLGRNGIFVDEIFRGIDEVVELTSGTNIQVGGINIRFMLPDAGGKCGDETTQGSEAVSAMSFDFEDGRGESIDIEQSEDGDEDFYRIDPPVHASGGYWEDEDDEDGNDQDSVGDEDDVDAREKEMQRAQAQAARKNLKARQKQTIKPSKVKLKLKMNPQPKQKAPKSTKTPKPLPTNSPAKAEQDTDYAQAAEKYAMENGGLSASQAAQLVSDLSLTQRKGPGRPPKDSLSKRVQSDIRKNASKYRGDQVKHEPAEVDNDESTKSPLAPSIAAPEKRKYTKRRKEDDQPGSPADLPRETIENDMLVEAPLPKAPKQPKEKKQKPARSPSPMWDRATLTEEQLAKPTQSYVVLIHDALLEAPSTGLSLPQIYRAISRKYPYFPVVCQTLGWQSSVRHNLGQHAAFQKLERDGKGYMWGLNSDVSIEKEKKRRPSPPTASLQSYHHTPNYRPPQAYYVPPANAPNGQMAYAHAQYNQYQAMPPGHGYPNAPAPSRIYPLLAQQNDVNSTYQSPYTSTSSAPSQTQQKAPVQVSTPVQASAQPPRYPHQEAPGQPTNWRPDSKIGVASQPNQAHSASSSAYTAQPQPRKNHIPAAVMEVVSKWKALFLNELADKANKEEIVTRGINHALDFPATAPGQVVMLSEEDQELEQTVIRSVKELILKMQEADRKAASTAACESPDLKSIVGVSSLPHASQGQLKQQDPLPKAASEVAAEAIKQGTPPTPTAGPIVDSNPTQVQPCSSSPPHIEQKDKERVSNWIETLKSANPPAAAQLTTITNGEAANGSFKPPTTEQGESSIAGTRGVKREREEDEEDNTLNIAQGEQPQMKKIAA